MMDFLRRLAPPRESDATRAVAVLPSRYASEGPLRNTAAQAGSPQRPEDDEASLSVDAPSASARHAGSGSETQGFRVPLPAANTQTHAAAALRHAGSGNQPPQTTPQQPPQNTPRPPGALDVRPTQRDIGKAALPPRLRAGEYNPDAAGAFTLQDQDGANSKRPPPASHDLHGPAKARDANHIFQDVAAPRARPNAALPLSQAALAQRTNNARDDSQVVHVTIGRIDVVANTAPAAAVRRNPTPRQATVTLSDYLRGGNGVRQ